MPYVNGDGIADAGLMRRFKTFYDLVDSAGRYSKNKLIILNHAPDPVTVSR
jgi:hypothetical protein